jgi:hypothetical protein
MVRFNVVIGVYAIMSILQKNDTTSDVELAYK